MNSFAKIIFPALALLALTAGLARADGIPVNQKTHEVTVPHTLLKLSESQIEEIETLNTLTLDSEQWKKLRKIGPYCPKRITDVLPVTWNDCTCGIGFYAIQISRDKVAITNDQLTYEGGLDLSAEASEADPDPTDLWLSVDRRGQFYHQGVLIPFTKLLELVAATPGKRTVDKEELSRWIGVQYPLGLDRKSDVLKSRLDQLFQTAQKAGWSTPDDN